MEIRKAYVQDVDDMEQLIANFAEIGLMLPRTAKSLCEHLQCFTVVTDGETVIGTAGLHILWKDLAEIRSLAVHPDYHGQGIGRKLVETLAAEANTMGISQVLSLTYQTEFFSRLKFQVVQKETLPHKIWKDCIHCKKFHNCDEIAMVYYTQYASSVYTSNAASR